MDTTHESDAILELLVRWDELRREGKTPTVEELCPGDFALQQRLRERLKRRERLQAFLALPDDTRHEGGHEVARLPAIEGYDIAGLVGRGGMGVVYKARQKELQRDVALKMVLSGASASAEERARFRTEAKAVAQLQHPNIVQIYEIGEQAGCPFLALEYVGGGSLAQKIDGKPLTPRRAAELVADLARAVQHAHEQGIVHRDLKPANVLLTQSGVAKIADFGLAKRIDGELSHTQTGAVLGSPSYMAPEQAEGKVRAIGPATDVYALGAILYELLTGRPPFVASSFLETLEQVRFHEPPPPQTLQPKVPLDLATICLKCLEKRPALRYASAQELAEDLQRFLDGEPITARSATLVEQMSRILQHSHVHVNFGAWATLTLWIAPIPIVAHSLIYLLFRDRPEYPVITLGVSMTTVVLVLYTVLFGKRAAMAMVPPVQRRQVWSSWIGHGIGFVIIPITVIRMVHPKTVEEWFLIYALWLTQVGGTFFTFGASAGFLYVTGAVCFLLALIVPWMPEYIPLVVGLMMTTNMMSQGLFLRHLARQAAAETQG